MFITSLRSAGDMAGVLEVDNETAYFYLYSMNSGTSPTVLGAINIKKFIRGVPEKSVLIRWDKNDAKCGIFLNERLIALYDVELLAETHGKIGKYIDKEIPNNISFS